MENETDGRKPNGQFAQGNKLHAPKRISRKQNLRRLFERSITADGMRKATANLMTQATTNTEDVAAIKLFLEYTVGKPEQVIESQDEDVADPGPYIERVLDRFFQRVLEALVPFPEAHSAVLDKLGETGKAGGADDPDEDEGF